MMNSMNERAKQVCNNWTPEVASLIATLKRHGFEMMKGDNGEETFRCNPGRDGMKKFIENLIACDESHLYIKDPQTGKTRWLYLVLGNSPGELVCDYSVPAGTPAADVLDKVTEEHARRWESRKQPTWTYAEAYPGLYGPKALAKRRLEELRAELRAERISYAELAELQGLRQFIAPEDVELLEAAGVQEGGAQ